MHSPCLEVDLPLLTRVALLTAVNKATAYFDLFVKCFFKNLINIFKNANCNSKLKQN